MCGSFLGGVIALCQIFYSLSYRRFVKQIIKVFFYFLKCFNHPVIVKKVYVADADAVGL